MKSKYIEKYESHRNKIEIKQKSNRNQTEMQEIKQTSNRNQIEIKQK